MIIRLSFSLLLVALLSLSATAREINSNAGTSSFPFLKIHLGARAVAMGGAATGLADDETALYYNPAGIVGRDEIVNNRFILEYHNYFDDIQSGLVGVIHKLDERKSVGVYVNYLNYGEFIETDQLGTVTGDFSGGDLAFAGAFAYQPKLNWRLGGTVKLIYQKIQEFSATGVAVDLGAKYSFDRERYVVGIAVQNLGVQLSSLGEEKDDLPLMLRAGGSVRPRQIPILLAADVIVPTDNNVDVAIGAEYLNAEPVFLRLGWNSYGSNYRAAESDDSWAGLSLGLGIDINKYQISYGFTPAAELGESHRITVTGGF